MRIRIAHLVGFVLGVGLSAASIEYGRFHAPRPTAPAPVLGLTQD